MKAIRTKYKKTWFASQLEARWAVYMDTLGVPWVYEPEGYDFEDGDQYRPDFWLPEHKTFLEIKPRFDPFPYADFGRDLALDWDSVTKKVISVRCEEAAREYGRARRLMRKLVLSTDKQGSIAIGDFYCRWVDDEPYFQEGVLFFGDLRRNGVFTLVPPPWGHVNEERERGVRLEAAQRQFDEWRRT